MDFQQTELGNEGELDLKKLVSRVLGNWHFFLISLIICVGSAFFYIKLSTPTYRISSNITIDDNQPSLSSGKSEAGAGVDLSDLFDLQNNAYNEIDILKTRSLMTNVVKALKLNVTIFRKSGFKSYELYDEAPFDLNVMPKKDSLEDRTFKVSVKGNNIHLVNDYEDVDEFVNFEKPIILQQYNIVFTRKPAVKVKSGEYKILIQSIDSKVEELLNNFDVDLTDKKSTTLNLTLEYHSSRKGEIILQKLMELYLQSNLENKIRLSDSTLKFIDRELEVVNRDLSGVESKFAQFKEDNNLADVDEQSKALVNDASAYFQKLSDIEIQLSLVNDLSKNVNDPSNKKFIPSSFSVQDPVFEDAIGKYNELLVERDKLLLSYKEDNPVMLSNAQLIENVRKSLVGSFNAYRQSLLTTLNQLKAENNTLNSQIKGAPKKERIFLDYTRQQNLKQDLDLYLLQKREEIAIEKKSTISTARIIDEAKSAYMPFEPKKSVIYSIGFFLGILLPYLILYLKDALNIKIVNKQDIEANTKIPVLGEIGNNEEDTAVVVGNLRSTLSEQFRALRTNMQFVLSSSKSNVILVTSSMSGEGKSFISANLGNVLAIGGKKVVLVELDLRKPKLSYNLGQDKDNGYTNFIVSDSIDLDSIIKPTFFSENCFLISSGPIPPNPSELLLNNKLDLLIANLRNKFDYIIIDTAPIGLVSDAQLLEKFADISLYIIRQEYTFKSQLNILNDLVKDGKFKKAYLVVNDIKTKKGGYYGYGYGYGYNDKKGKKRGLFKKK